MNKRIRRTDHPITSAGALLLTLVSGYALAEDLDTISVTATRVERGTKDVPAAISVIDRKTIENRRMLNIKEAIQGTPGVLIDTKNGGYDVRLIIRGAGQKANYGVREIMVLRDGVPMTDPDSFSRFDFIDTQDIERIEITKGPGSLYGAGSAGGTVQIISKSVFDPDANRAKTGLGDYGAQNMHLRFGGDINDSNAAALTASRRKLDSDWRRWNEFETHQIGFKHGLMFDDGSTLESELSYSEADLQLPGSMSRDQFDEFRETGKQTDTQDAWKHSGRYSEIWFFNSRLEKEWGDLTLKPRLYYNHWSHYHPVTGVINDNPGTDVFGADFEFAYEHELLGPSTLVAGITARRDRTDDGRKYKYRHVTEVAFGPPPPRITETLSDEKGDLIETKDSTNTLYGLYMLETVNPAERWTVDLGFRVDRSHFDIRTNEMEKYDYAKGNYVPGAGVSHLDETFYLFSPKIGLTYALTDQINLFAVVAQSDQVPSDSELDKNQSLDPSTARNIEIGLKGRATDWSFDLSLYNTRVTDEIVSILLPGGDTTFDNAGETDKLGLEFSGRYRLLDHLWLGLNYAYSDYEFEDFVESGVDLSDNQLPYVPRHQYSLRADYEHPSGFKAAIQADSWGSYYMDNSNTEKYGGYDFVTSLMLGYERGPHSLALNVENVFDKRYAVEVKKSVAGPSTKYYYYAGAPRSAMLTYRYQF